MLAVAENDRRIRPPVTVVQMLAAAVGIGAGRLVGREDPTVQAASALVSTLGRLVRMPKSRLRIIVACDAADAICATFNAPTTRPFSGLEIV
jgi:chloride channel protein, CIC family